MVVVDNNAVSLEEQVYMMLEEEILSGELKPGEQLKEQALSARLGVSRTPIRAASHRLSEIGLVETSANRGATVVGVSEEDIEDTYRIRIRLEGLASAMAANRMSEQDRAALTEAVELSEFYLVKRDAEKLREQDTVFHRIIFEASGNRLLARILTDMHRNIKLYRKRALSDPARTELSVREHREILDAIVSADAERADALTAAHAERAMENALKNIKR